jgi:hypothetical protein
LTESAKESQEIYFISQRKSINEEWRIAVSRRNIGTQHLSLAADKAPSAGEKKPAATAVEKQHARQDKSLN